jgi:hypothetical protein
VADNRIGGVYRGKTYNTSGFAPDPKVGPEGGGIVGVIKKGYNALANIGSTKPAAAAGGKASVGRQNMPVVKQSSPAAPAKPTPAKAAPAKKAKPAAKKKSKPQELPAAQLQQEARDRRAKMAAQNARPGPREVAEGMKKSWAKQEARDKRYAASKGREDAPIVKQPMPKKSTMVYDKGLGRMVDRGVSGLKRAPNR